MVTPDSSASINPHSQGSEAKPTPDRAAKKASGAIESFGLLYGNSPVMRELYLQLERVARTPASVLIIGESGTGKELIAKTIHDRSHRHGQAFIPVNCGAIPSSLIEAELFGHEKGSFTGASQQHVGYFEHASGGTIFLDEITEMAPEMQVKLLRVLEAGTFHRVGGIDSVSVDVRVVAATNRDPQVAVSERIFREDLLYRLAVFPLRAPPLRERDGDIELLAHHFLGQFNATENSKKVFSKRSLETLRAYGWPGNVRELRNTIHRAFIMADSIIEITNANLSVRTKRPHLSNGALHVAVGTPLAEAQREIILATLDHFSGDKKRTATTLGVSLKTLYNRLEAYQSGAPLEDPSLG